VAGRARSRVGVGVVLLGAAFGYAAGVVGPAAAPVSNEFDVSLAATGLMTSVFFIGIAAFELFGAPVEDRMGIPWTARLAGLLMGIGGLLSAVSPWFTGLLTGRALTGLGTGAALIVCPVIARALRSALLLGFYGGGITTGLAVALFVGGELQDAGVDWRVNVGISGAIGFAAVPFLFGPMPAIEHMRRVGLAGVKKLLVSWSFYRADLLFVFVNAVPIIVGAWLIPYLDRHHGIAAGVAGALGFVLFAAQTVARPLSAKVGVSTTSRLLLSTVGPALAALAILALALDQTTGLATVAIVVLGFGFGAPYAIAYQRIENQVEGNPELGLAVGFQAVNIVAIVVTPLIGSALEHGYGELSFILLAVFCALTGLANFTRRAG
jgi:MFS family permease